MYGDSFPHSLLRATQQYEGWEKELTNILLIVQKSQNNHLGCKKNTVDNGINYQPQLVSRISFMPQKENDGLPTLHFQGRLKAVSFREMLTSVKSWASRAQTNKCSRDTLDKTVTYLTLGKFGTSSTQTYGGGGDMLHVSSQEGNRENPPSNTHSNHPDCLESKLGE